MVSQENLECGHLSVGQFDREWRPHGKLREPLSVVTFRSASLITNGGLMVSQENL